MPVIFTTKAKCILKLALPFVLLFQWTIPSLDKKRNVYLNFSDITFQKCNDPEHSHPPLSEKVNQKTPDKLVSSDLNNPFIVKAFLNCFDITAKIIFEKPGIFPKFLVKHFPPARSPPLFEV